MIQFAIFNNKGGVGKTMAVNPFVLKCYGHFKFYMLMNHLKYD